MRRNLKWQARGLAAASADVKLNRSRYLNQRSKAEGEPAPAERAPAHSWFLFIRGRKARSVYQETQENMTADQMTWGPKPAINTKVTCWRLQWLESLLQSTIDHR